MNGSFESPSHLERRIRAEIEDVSDSSLSAPGFGRRANSESLSFATDNGSDDGKAYSYQPSMNRVLPDLSEVEFTRTPTARSSHTTTRGPVTLASALEQAGPSKEDGDGSRGSMQAKNDLAVSTSSDGASEDGSAARGTDRSLPLTSTPQKTSYTQRSQTTFYSQRSGQRSLARQATEAAARDLTQQSDRSGNTSARRDSTGSAWSDPTGELRPELGDAGGDDGSEASVATIDQPSLSHIPASGPSRIDDTGLGSGREQASLLEAETSRGRAKTHLNRPAGASREAIDAETTAGSVASGSGREPSPAVTPSSVRTGASMTPSGLATPRPTVSADRMQSYVLSSMKDPAREQRILQTARKSGAQRVGPRRVPIGQDNSEDSDIAVSRALEQTPAPPTRAGLLGKPMTRGAGRTPLPFRPSHLANEIAASDASSQVSAESSTYDLMTPARGWANTSLPGLGVAEGNVPQMANRVDPHKLSRHLHKLNEGLLDENAELKEAAASAQQEAESLRRQLNSALREKENLLRNMPSRPEGRDIAPADIPLPPSPAADDVESNEDLQRALDDAIGRIEELEGHKEELNDMLDALEGEHEKLLEERQALREARTRINPDGTKDVAGEQDALVEELEADLQRCEEDLRARDEEIQSLQDQLQASEQQRTNLHAEIEDAANFAMQQTGKFEEERDAALEVADRRQQEVEELQKKIDRLESNASKRRTSAAADLRDDENADTDLQTALEQMREELEDVDSARREAEDALQQERDHVDELVRGHDDDMHTLEEERKQLERQVDALATEADELRDELDRQRIAVEEKQNEILKLTRQASSGQRGDFADVAKIDSLEEELSEARQQLRLLKSGHHERELAAKDLELSNLRKQKDSLEERLESYRQQAQTSMSLANAVGPSAESTLAKTPAKHRNLLNLQTPVKTPASPGHLSSASWLYNESSVGNASVVEHIKHLEELLTAANAQLDEKLSEIDQHGVSHLTVTKRLFEAQDRIEALEAELQQIMGKAADRQAITERVKRIRCHSCKSRFDATAQVRLPWHESAAAAASGGQGPHSSSAFSTTADATDDRKNRSMYREQALAEFVEKIPQLTARLTEIEEENRVLRDAQSKTNAGRAGSSQAAAAMSREAAKQLQQQTFVDIGRARAAIVDLDSELREERRRLPDLARDSKLFGNLSKAAERDLSRTEVRLRRIEGELRRKAAEHADLQRDLIEKSSVGSSVNVQLQVLEGQVRQAAEQVEQLRQDKNAILETRKELHEQFRSASERYASVQASLAKTKDAAAVHQAQLEEQTDKIGQLHATLKEQSEDIQRLTGERSRLHAQREVILRDVSTLEADLIRVRAESQRFGQDLEKLRQEKEQQQRLRVNSARETSVSITAEAQETIAQLKDKLAQAQRMIRQLEVGDGTTSSLRAKHEAECKGLLLQIRYLKTKFMRESDLRQDLCFQKSYLLQIVGGLEMSEQETVRFLADLEQSRKRMLDDGDQTVRDPRRATRGRDGNAGSAAKLRKVLTAVRAAARMKLMASRWKQTRAVREALLNAHQAARKRRDQRLAVSDDDHVAAEKAKVAVPTRGRTTTVDDDADDALLLGGPARRRLRPL
ncbi:unnamed protein product [Parajaminaea phylloscopi]